MVYILVLFFRWKRYKHYGFLELVLIHLIEEMQEFLWVYSTYQPEFFHHGLTKSFLLSNNHEHMSQNWILVRPGRLLHLSLSVWTGLSGGGVGWGGLSSAGPNLSKLACAGARMEYAHVRLGCNTYWFAWKPGTGVDCTGLECSTYQWELELGVG